MSPAGDVQGIAPIMDMHPDRLLDSVQVMIVHTEQNLSNSKVVKVQVPLGFFGELSGSAQSLSVVSCLFFRGQFLIDHLLENILSPAFDLTPVDKQGGRSADPGFSGIKHIFFQLFLYS